MTWVHRHTIQVGEHAPDLSASYFLTKCGSMVICGGRRNDSKEGFVLVLDVEALTCEHTLLLDRPVDSLLSLRGEVWGQLDRKVGDIERRTRWWCGRRQSGGRGRARQAGREPC